MYQENKAIIKQANKFSISTVEFKFDEDKTTTSGDLQQVYIRIEGLISVFRIVQPQFQVIG